VRCGACWSPYEIGRGKRLVSLSPEFLKPLTTLAQKAGDDAADFVTDNNN
jgi:hypothetical protein